MTQNLRLSGGRTLPPSDSDVDSDWIFPNNSLTSGDSYTEARSTISSNTSYGGYYNYCAASAGTGCNNTTAQDAAQSVCPAGWTLPTEAQFDAIAGNSSYSSAFSPIHSGYYDNGSFDYEGSYGRWWSATANGSYNQYSLYYDGLGWLNTYGRDNKSNGYSVRCVRSS